MLCKPTVIVLLSALVAVVITSGALSAERKVELSLFWEPSCPYCKRAKNFLEKQQETNTWLKIQAHNIAQSKETAVLFARTNARFEITQPAVPLIVIGDRHFLGYDDDRTTGHALMQAARDCHVSQCPNLASVLEFSPGPSGKIASDSHKQSAPGSVRVPVVGELSLEALSLPTLTILLAALDGFNPCAMWVLVFLIGLLMGMKDRMKMWLLGAAFLLTSGLVYFGFLAAWLNIFLVIGMLFWVRIGVGSFAIASGLYYLREYAINAAAECKVTNPRQRQRIMTALKASVAQKRFLFALLGIMVLAVIVNLIELFCSAGIPAVYTDILAMNDLSALQYFGYLTLYVVVFMLDDAAIFVLAMLALSAGGMTDRYLRLSHLLGGIVMTVIGVLLLFAPGWLTFTA